MPPRDDTSKKAKARAAQMRKHADAVGEAGGADQLRADADYIERLAREAASQAEVDRVNAASSKRNTPSRARGKTRRDRDGNTDAGDEAAKPKKRRKGKLASAPGNAARRVVDEAADVTLEPVGFADNMWLWAGIVLSLTFVAVVLKNEPRVAVLLGNLGKGMDVVISPWTQWPGLMGHVSTSSTGTPMQQVAYRVPSSAPGTSGRTASAPAAARTLPTLTTTQGTLA